VLAAVRGDKTSRKSRLTAVSWPIAATVLGGS
jgi:hypothetical protein